MTNLLGMAENTDLFNQEVRNYIDASLYRLQQARLATLENATLADLFKGRNPYLLRTTGHEAYQLMRESLDHYLASTDEAHFEKYTHELTTFLEQSSRQRVEPAQIIEQFAPKRLPFRFELLDLSDRTYNRLTRQFFVELCDEVADIDWKRLTRFISECEA